MGKKFPINIKDLVGDFNQSPTKFDLTNFYLNKDKILDLIVAVFLTSTSLIPKIGIELEFYLLNPDKSKVTDSLKTEQFIEKLFQITSQNSFIYQIEKEQGVGQIELKTIFTSNLNKLCQEIEFIKSQAEKIALGQNLIISFDAQTFEDDCGSAMQFNISLHDEKGENLYISNKKFLENSITSLLNFTDAILVFLAPNEKDYIRFNNELNHKLFKSGKYSAPINLSFGIDNRTCAIRLSSGSPNSKNSCPNSKKRLEYRIASANCDPYLSIASILAALTNGITCNMKLSDYNFEQVYGNAFDRQYKLSQFSKSYDEALSNFFKRNIFEL